MTAVGHLDKVKIKRSFAAAAGSYDELAVLQRQVGLALLEKYPLDASPGVILDVGCGTGFLSRQLPVDSSSQHLVALDIAFPMLLASRQKNLNLPVHYLCADAESMPFAAHSIRQIYSNLALQWCQDLPAVFAGCKRVLKFGGQLVFATFGSSTLRELKSAWAEVDGFAHVNEFYGFEQINWFLQDAGFQSISSEVAMYQSSYPSVMALMRELKGIGAHNVNMDRNKKPTTRRQLQHMISCYEGNMVGTEVLASYEIIFVRAQR
ncbi:MAG: malonyl-ACP O-methyltransferase BioC [Methylococcaceae bacterium]|nr:malonyl-ACP O-methyltransferase BioC [Methylococcaceae bacterium]